MSMQKTQTGQQPFTPFQGSFRTGLQAGSVLNSFGLLGWFVAWLMPTTRLTPAFNFFNGAGWFFNTMKRRR